MSHLPERPEKICLNCGTTVIGRYCHVCGQENLEPKESVWHLAAHFFEDITHFDGKFFSSSRYLLFKPGFLAKEYTAGKRVSYLNPIRMYLLTSAIFLLVLLNFVVTPSSKYDSEIAQVRDSMEQHYNGSPAQANKQISLSTFDLENGNHYLYFVFPTKYVYQRVYSYDSLQKQLPDSSKDGWFMYFLTRRVIAAANVYHKDPNAFMEKFVARFAHSSSQIFLVSLPLFALLLQLLYIRRRKEFYYVSHLVFSIHFYCFCFLMILLIIFFNQIGVVGYYLEQAAIILMFVYLYIAMLRFYKQGWVKTLVKYFMLQIPFIVIMISIGLIFFLNSMLGIAKM